MLRKTFGRSRLPECFAVKYLLVIHMDIKRGQQPSTSRQPLRFCEIDYKSIAFYSTRCSAYIGPYTFNLVFSSKIGCSDAELREHMGFPSGF